MDIRNASRSSILCGCISLILVLCGNVSTAQSQMPKEMPETHRLNIGLSVPALSYLPIWVAHQKGFLKEEGVTDVKVLAFRGGADLLQSLTAGTVDLSVQSLAELVISIKSGQMFKAVWAGFNQPYFDWYAQPKFKSIAATKGSRYAVTKYGAITDFLTRYALRSAGLDPDKDVKILQLGGSPQSLAALEAGQLECTILSAPSSYMAAEKGFVKLMSQKDYIAPDWPLHVVFGKEEYIARNPNTIKAFLRSNGRAVEWIKTNREEAAQIGSKTGKFKIEHCRRFIDEQAEYWFADGRLPDKGMKVFWEIAVQAGDVTEPWPNGKWLDETFLRTQSEWRR